MKEAIDSSVIEHQYCIGAEIDKGSCKSSDALAIYQNEYEDGSTSFSGFCWSCKTSFNQRDLANSTLHSVYGLDPEDGKVKEAKVFEKKQKQPPLTRKEVIDMIKGIGYDGWEDYRGLKKEYLQFFGHLAKTNDAGEIIEAYYPETQYLGTKDPYPTGYKIRYIKSKKFNKIGVTGMKSDLAGFAKFKDLKNHRSVVIVGGEVDMVSVYQAFAESQKAKNQTDYMLPAIVSPTTGESSAAKQVQRHYEWLNGFEKIYIGMDADEAGENAAKEIAAVLPQAKVHIINWSMKDPNNMIQKGKQKQILSDYYNAKPLVKTDVVASANVMSHVLADLEVEKVSIPDVVPNLNKLLNGGFDRGTIVNIVAPTSVGKSLFVNTFTRHWALSGERVGVLSLEATAGRYMTDLLGIHMKQNFGKMDKVDAKTYLTNEDNQEQINELLIDEDGDSRIHIMDTRDTGWEVMKDKIEQLVRKEQITILVIDVMSDLSRVMSVEDQVHLTNYLSALTKDGLMVVQVLHTRKPPAPKPNSTPVMCTENEIVGSSSFAQIASTTITLGRIKTAKDEIAKNSTLVMVEKARRADTGEAGVMYYNWRTNNLYNREKYFAEHPDELPQGYHLDRHPFMSAYYKEDNPFGYNPEHSINRTGGGNTATFKKKPKEDTKDFVDGYDGVF